MLRKIFFLALIFHFGEFTKIERVLTYIPGPPTIFIAHTVQKISLPLRPSPNQPQYNQYQPSIDGANLNERLGNNEDQLNQPNSNQAYVDIFNANSYFQNQQNPQINQQNRDQQNRNPQINQQNRDPQINQQNRNPQINQPQATPRPVPQQPRPSSAPNNQNLHFMNDKIEATTFRYPTKFDRTSMVTSEEEYTQKPDQRPSSDSSGDQNNKNNNQDDPSSTYPNDNIGLLQSQVPFNKQSIVNNNNLPLEHFNKPDENAIIIPNMPSNVIEIIFPPTLSYDEDASTTTRASILDIRRRTSTTESSYNYQQK